MADNVLITQGSGTTIAADDIGGVLHQRVKLSQGADGSATDVSSAAPLNVTLANTGANATAVKVDGSAVTQPVSLSGTVAVTQSGTWDEVGINDSGNSITVDNSTLAVVGGGTEATAMRVTIASDSTGVVSIDDNGGSITVDGTVAVSGTVTVGSHAVTNAGTFAVQNTAATPAGTNNIGDVDVLTINGVAPAFGTGVRGATVQRVTIATDDSVPVTIASVPSHAVTNAGTFATQSTLVPQTLASGAITTAMTGTTSTSLISATASNYIYITQVTVSNSHATVGTDVILQDGSGGTTLYTIPAGALYGGATITFPKDSPLKVPTAGNALYCANVTTGASTKVSASGWKSTVSY